MNTLPCFGNASNIFLKKKKSPTLGRVPVSESGTSAACMGMKRLLLSFEEEIPPGQEVFKFKNLLIDGGKS